MIFSDLAVLFILASEDMSIIVERNSNFDERVEGIRRLVAIGLSTTNDLTDNDIVDDVFLGFSNRFMVKRVPNWNILTGDARANLEVAVQKKCASELLKSTARRVYFDAQSVSDRQIYLDIEKTISTYEADIELLIKEIEPESSSIPKPIFQVTTL